MSESNVILNLVQDLMSKKSNYFLTPNKQIASLRSQ